MLINPALPNVSSPVKPIVDSGEIQAGLTMYFSYASANYLRYIQNYLFGQPWTDILHSREFYLESIKSINGKIALESCCSTLNNKKYVEQHLISQPAGILFIICLMMRTLRVPLGSHLQQLVTYCRQKHELHCNDVTLIEAQIFDLLNITFNIYTNCLGLHSDVYLRGTVAGLKHTSSNNSETVTGTVSICYPHNYLLVGSRHNILFLSNHTNTVNNFRSSLYSYGIPEDRSKQIISLQSILNVLTEYTKDEIAKEMHLVYSRVINKALECAYPTITVGQALC